MFLALFTTFRENLVEELLSYYYLKIALNDVLEHLENQNFFVDLRWPTFFRLLFLPILKIARRGP